MRSLTRITTSKILSNRFRLLVSLAALAGVAARFPSVSAERGPYLFCDEVLFFGDTLRMVRDESFVSSEFRSGPVNVYPMFVVGVLVSQFFELSGAELLSAGRLVLPVMLGGLAAIPIGYFSKLVSNSSSTGLIAAALVAFSPGVVGISKIWYPDHYIIFFSGLVALFLAKVMVEEPRWTNALFLGMSLALALAVKYTAVLLLLPVFLVYLGLIRRDSSPQRIGSKRSSPLFSATIFLGSVSFFSVVIHLNSLFNIGALLAAQQFNAENYGGLSADPLAGVVAYGLVILLLLFGPIGLVGTLAATFFKLRARRFFELSVLVSAPVGAVLVLGSQEMFINRNVMVVAPFVAALAASGLFGLWNVAVGRSAVAAVRIGIAALACLQISVLLANVIHDLRPDSRPLAEMWISENLPSETVVGTNDFCSGRSPAAVVGLETVKDPRMSERLDVYVFVSYWASSIEDNYRGRAASEAFIHQRYFHFYFFDDKDWFKSLPGLWEQPPEIIPEGYELMKRFESSGPSVWILERQQSDWPINT